MFVRIFVILCVSKYHPLKVPNKVISIYLAFIIRKALVKSDNVL